MKRKRPGEAVKNAVKKQKVDGEFHQRPSYPLLRQYYACVVTLRQYLASRLKKRRRRRLLQYGRCGSYDDASVCQLLDVTVIGTHVPVNKQDESIIVEEDISIFTQQLSNTGAASTLAPGTFKQSEIIDFAIWLLFRRHQGNSRPRHLLCQNFQRYLNAYNNGKDPEIVPGIPGIYSNGPNENAQNLRIRPWDKLPDLLGTGAERVLGDLFLDCGIFTPVGSSSNMIQLSGIPMCDLSISAVSAGPKLEREAFPNKPALNERHGLSDIRFVRHRMLYARPAFNAKGSVKFGLNTTHIFNRTHDCDNIEETKHVIKYLFPAQFALHNVFTSTVDPKDTAQVFKDYTIREKEITRQQQAHILKIRLAGKGVESKPQSLPRRLRGKLFDLVRRVRKRNSTCAYAALLNHYCPKFLSDNETLASSPQLATRATQVSAFCRAVISRVFPKDFWGQAEIGSHNLCILHRNIDLFVRLRRYESITLHDILQNMSLRDIDWLAPPAINKSMPLSATDFSKRKEIMAELLYYLFDSFLIPLIRGHFHVTESNVQRNQLFYFRHDTWQTMSEPALKSLRQDMLEECSAESIKKLLAKRTLGVSSVRLLPKEQGMRPIINLRRRVQKLQHGHLVLGKSINSILTPAFSVLNYEKGAKPHLLGSALFSVDDIFPRLQTFRDSLKRKGLNGQPLYFAKVDVQACFDTIPQKRLLRLVRGIVGEEEYQIARYSRVKLTGSLGGMKNNTSTTTASPGSFGAKPAWKFLTKAVPSAGAGSFDFGLETDRDTSEGRTGTVYINNTLAYRSESRRAILSLLEEHIQCNLIKIGRRFYRQKEGIPQGSIVSSLLCSYFYAELEREVLGFIQDDDDGGSMLMRLIDDFLVVSTDRRVAERFVRRMHSGAEEFGVRVKGEKSRVNFELEVEGKRVEKEEGGWFPFCGKEIGMRGLDLRRDWKRRKGLNLSDSITVEYSRLPGQTFYRKTLNILKLQLQTMHLSTNYNSLPTVLVNLYHNFREVAQKSWYYIRSLGGGKRPAGRLIIRTIDDMIRLSCILIKRRKGAKKKGEILEFECCVTEGQTRWLASTAFLSIFSLKQTNFQLLIFWLKAQLELPVIRRMGGKEKKLLMDAIATVATAF